MPEVTTDILREFSYEKAQQFCSNILRKEWPYSIHANYFIMTCFSWREKEPNIDVKLLYYRDSLESGIFVGLLKSGSRTITMTIYALENREDLLMHVLHNTSFIPWDKLPLLQGILPRHYSILENVISKKGLGTKIYVHSTLQVMKNPWDICSTEIKCPSNIYISNLTTKDLEYIYEVWPIKDIYTKEELENSIKLNFGYGIYCKSDNSLLAWAMQAHYGGVGMLQTKDSSQRKGYGKLICQFVSKRISESGVHPFAFIKDTNVKSKFLFWSLGYTEISPIIYATVCEKLK